MSPALEMQKPAHVQADEPAQRTQKPLVLYHADCNDSLTAAWCVMDAYRSIGQEVELVPCKYQTPPPDVTGRLVIIVDFSYKRPVLLEMAEKAERIEIYDHHKSAQEDLEGLEHPNLYIEFDMDRSGAGIAWDAFHPNYYALEETPDGALPRPWFVNYVEDNDLWRHKLPDCKAVIEFIRSWPAETHFQLFDVWAKEGPEGRLQTKQQAMAAGRGILRAKQVMTQQAVTFSHRKELLIGDGPYQGVVPVLAANVPFFLSSEVAGLLAEMNAKQGGPAVGITYYQREDGRWSLSFRSVGDYDVSKLALSFGGGGHRNAAGATVKFLPWDPTVALLREARTLVDDEWRGHETRDLHTGNLPTRLAEHLA